MHLLKDQNLNSKLHLESLLFDLFRKTLQGQKDLTYKRSSYNRWNKYEAQNAILRIAI